METIITQQVNLMGDAPLIERIIKRGIAVIRALVPGDADVFGVDGCAAESELWEHIERDVYFYVAFPGAYPEWHDDVRALLYQQLPHAIANFTGRRVEDMDISYTGMTEAEEAFIDWPSDEDLQKLLPTVDEVMVAMHYNRALEHFKRYCPKLPGCDVWDKIYTQALAYNLNANETEWADADAFLADPQIWYATGKELPALLW